jgi:hypothetical protein
MHIGPQLTEGQLADYMGNVGFRVVIHGRIIHVGVAKEQSPLMIYHATLVCGRAISVPHLEHESIRLIPIEPAPKLGLRHYLRLYWESRKRKDGGDQSEDEAN